MEWEGKHIKEIYIYRKRKMVIRKKALEARALCFMNWENNVCERQKKEEGRSVRQEPILTEDSGGPSW